MTHFEFIKSLSMEDMADFLAYVCLQSCNYGGLRSVFRIKGFKENLEKEINQYLKYNASVNINVGRFLSSVYEGKTVYQHIHDMPVEELSGLFCLIGCSLNTSKDILEGFCTPSWALGCTPYETYVEYLNREIIDWNL